MTTRAWPTLAAVRVAGEVLLLVWALSYLRYRVASHEGRVLLAVLPRGTPRDLSYDIPLEEEWPFWVSCDEWSWSGYGLEAHAGTVYSGGIDVADRTYGTVLFAAPFPLLVIPCAAVAAAVAAVERRRLGRKRAGRCPDCGYDLRATADRCPECGRAVAGPAVVEPVRHPTARFVGVASALAALWLAVAWGLSFATYSVDSFDGRLIVSVVHGGNNFDLEPIQGIEWMLENWRQNANRRGAGGDSNSSAAGG